MFANLPISGGSIGVELPGSKCPPDIHEWLVSLGWYSTREHCFSNSRGSTGYYDLHWNEAVVVELYRIVTIGGHQ